MTQMIDNQYHTQEKSLDEMLMFLDNGIDIFNTYFKEWHGNISHTLEDAFKDIVAIVKDEYPEGLVIE